jgi:hypothetical protein
VWQKLLVREAMAQEAESHTLLRPFRTIKRYDVGLGCAVLRSKLRRGVRNR